MALEGLPTAGSAPKSGSPIKASSGTHGASGSKHSSASSRDEAFRTESSADSRANRADSASNANRNHDASSSRHSDSDAKRNEDSRTSDSRRTDSGDSRSANESRSSGSSGSERSGDSRGSGSADSRSSGASNTNRSQASGAAGANSTQPSSDKAGTATEFSTILAGTLGASSPTVSSDADKPVEPKSDDDATPDDEIGFEDLSEFLSQVLVPGASPPSPPGTVEIDFEGDDDLSSGIMSAISADGREKISLAAAQDRFANAIATTNPLFSADSSLLKDALASEKLVATALDPTAAAVLPDASVDLDGANSTAFSPLHAAALHTTHAPSSPTLQAEVRSPMGTQAWADEVGGHLTWMATNGRESASLTVSPEHLGPIEVRISMQDGQASVWFGAQNADTRTALEQALPRLRDLFSSQGLSLADSGVFREAPRQQPQNFSGGSHGSAGVDDVAVVTGVAKRGNGILDLYA